MPISCQICQKTFDKIITSTHLKSHSVSSHEYKEKYGDESLSCPIYRQERSIKYSGTNNPMFGKKHDDSAKDKISTLNKGRVAHNKGKKVTDEQQLEKIRTALKIRDDNYRQNQNHPRKGAVLTDFTKSKIRDAIKNYAKDNKEKISERALKAVNTKRSNGYDLGSNMRGKKLSTNTKELISQKSKITAAKKISDAIERYKTRAESAGLIINSIVEKRVNLTCSKCNAGFIFTAQYFTDSKFRFDMCPVCRLSPTKSADEIAILEYIKTIYKGEVLSGNRSVIYPLELDIYIPEMQLAIEYCGLYWHSEKQGKDSKYHLEKYTKCMQLGIRLITIFEDEWIHNSDLIKSRLNYIFKHTNNRIGARKLIVKQIENKTAHEFCDQNHIQGRGQANVSYGLFDENMALFSVMTFSKPSISKGSTSSTANAWEMNRFCSQKNTVILGGGSKLFKKFIEEFNPAIVITYSDNRWNTGQSYKNMGFNLTTTTPPSYWYIDFPNIKRIHRFSLRKNDKDDPNLTEWQNRIQQGYDRIWDCGNKKWEWKNTSTPI